MLRVLVAVEVEAAQPAPADLTLGYSMRNLDGDVVGELFEETTLRPADRPGGAVLEHVASFVVEPGTYTLTLAAVDGGGRRGSVEHPVRAWQLSGPSFAVGDLLLADAPAPSDSGISAPVEAKLSSDRLAVYTELYADEASALSDLHVRIEVAEEASGLPRASGTSVPAAGNHPNSQIVSAIMPVDALQPRRYVARVVVVRENKTIGQVSRPFHITRPLAKSDTSRDVLAGLGR